MAMNLILFLVIPCIYFILFFSVAILLKIDIALPLILKAILTSFLIIIPPKIFLR